MSHLPRHRLRRAALAGCATALVAGGCSRQAEVVPPKAASPPISAPATAQQHALTVGEAERWGNDFVTALATGDIATANDRIDWNAIVDAATCDLGVPETVRGQFVAWGKQTAAESGLVRQLARVEQAGGDVALVRCRIAGDECHALFRVLHESVLNYYDARLVRRGDVVRAADIDVYLAGEPVSATLRRYFLTAAAKQAPVALQSSSGLDGDLVRHADALKALFAAADASDHARVLEVARELPPSLQRSKAILMVRIIAAAQADEEEHARAIAELQDAFPDAPCRDLVTIDFHSLRREHDACRAAIDRLDERVGGDPYLDVLRAATCLEAHDHAGAIGSIEAAIGAMPDLVQPYWIRVAISLDQQKHDDTAVWLDTISKRFGVTFPDLEGVPKYAEFVKSPEYRDWKARREN